MSERPSQVPQEKAESPRFEDPRVKKIALALFNQMKERQTNPDYQPDEKYLHSLTKEARAYIRQQRDDANTMLTEAVSEGISRTEMQNELAKHLEEYERFETLLDRIEELFPTRERVEQKPLDEWKTKLISDEDVVKLTQAINNAAIVETETIDLLEGKEKDIRDAVENLKLKIGEKIAPVKDKFSQEATQEIQKQLDQATLPLGELARRLELLRRKAAGERGKLLKQKLDVLDGVISHSEVDSADDSTKIESKESLLKNAVDTLSAYSEAMVGGLEGKDEAEVQKLIKPVVEKANTVLAQLFKRKTELLNTEVENRKALVSATIKDIVGTPLTDTLVAERAKSKGISALEYLRQLKLKLDSELAAVASLDKTFSPLSFGQKAIELLNSMIEVQEILHMSYPDLVEELLKAKENIDPYIPNPQMISDRHSRLLVNTFQQYSFPALKDHATPEEEREYRQEKLAYHRARIKVFCQRFEIVHGGTENMPAADTDKLYELMDPKNWGLTRVDILSFTNDKTPGNNGKSVGENVQEMLRYLVDVGGRNKDRKIEGYRPDPEEEVITYSEAIQTKGGKNPKERLKAFARNMFLEERKTVDEQGKPLAGEELRKEMQKKASLTQEEFDLAWKLYYTFDLFGISLALRQKWTQTRAHNTHQKNDPNYLSRPFHVGAHKLNRYGNDANSLLWLTAFSSTYPNEWAYSRIPSPDNSYEDEGIQKGQELVIKFKEAGMPVEGVVNMINPDPRRPESQYAFCRWWDATETTRDGVKGFMWRSEWNDLTPAKKEDRFTEAKRRFVLELADDTLLSPEIRKRAKNKALTPEDREKIDKLFEEKVDLLYLRQWDQALFPDHLAFLTSPLSRSNNPEDPESLANFMVAQKGWEKLLDTAIGDLKTSDGKVTYGAVFDEGGLWDQFVGGGLGLAKLVPGKHKKIFAPLTRDFIGRIGALFIPDPGKSPVEERKRLASQLVRSLKQATKQGEGGLYGLEGFDEIIHDLEEHAMGKFSLKIWDVVPNLLRPESIRIHEYEDLVCATFEHKYKKPAPRDMFGIKWRIPAVGYIPNVRYNADELQDFKDMMNRIEFPERPASRKKDTDTTAKKEK